jgi:hypothetical protein
VVGRACGIACSRVRAVVNEIQVRLEGDDEVSNVGIAEAAARALELDSLVPDGAVKASRITQASAT